MTQASPLTCIWQNMYRACVFCHLLVIQLHNVVIPGSWQATYLTNLQGMNECVCEELLALLSVKVKKGCLVISLAML